MATGFTVVVLILIAAPALARAETIRGLVVDRARGKRDP